MKRIPALLCAVCLPFFGPAAVCALESESGQHGSAPIGASGEEDTAYGFSGSVEGAGAATPTQLEADPLAQRYEARLDFSWSNGFVSAVNEDLILPENTFEFLLVRPVGEAMYTPDLYIDVAWDVSEVDPAVPGSYDVTCIPSEPLPYAVAGLDGLRVPCHIVERGRPYLMIVSALYEGGVELWLYEEAPEHTAMQFSMSVGDQSNWRAIDVEPHDYLPQQMFLTEPLPTLDETYYFRAEFLDGPMAGISNVIEYFYSSEDFRNEGGGDRTGTDRDGAGDDEDPDEETPPGDSDPEEQIPPNSSGGKPESNGGDRGDGNSGARTFPDTDRVDNVVPVIAEAVEPLSAPQADATPENAYAAVMPLPVDHPEPEAREPSTQTALSAAVADEASPVDVPVPVALRSSPPESSPPGEPFHTGAAIAVSTAAAALLGGGLLVRRIRSYRR